MKKRYSTIGILVSLSFAIWCMMYSEIKTKEINGLTGSIHRSEANSESIIKNMAKLNEAKNINDYDIQEESVDNQGLNLDFKRVKTNVLNTWVDKDDASNISGVTYIVLEESGYYNSDTLKNIKYEVLYNDKVIDDNADYNVVYSKNDYNNTQIAIIAINGEYYNGLNVRLCKGISNKTDVIPVEITDKKEGKAYRIVDIGEDSLVFIKTPDEKLNDNIEMVYNPDLDKSESTEESAGEIQVESNGSNAGLNETVENTESLLETTEESKQDEDNTDLEDEEAESETETVIHDNNDELYTVNYSYSIYGKKEVLNKIIAGDISMIDLKSSEEFIDYTNLQSKWDEYNLSNAYADILNVKLGINIKMYKSRMEEYIAENGYTNMNKNQTILEFKDYISRKFKFNIEKDDFVASLNL